jgi:hypothetical protein
MDGPATPDPTVPTTGGGQGPVEPAEGVPEPVPSAPNRADSEAVPER